ncbi:MAG: hypothetical protein ACTHN2_20215 [Nitrobacter sp.]
MNSSQRALIIATLVTTAAMLAFVFLNWGEGAFSSMGGDRIGILVLSQDRNTFIGNGYGLYTTKGIPGVLLGLIAPMFLLAGAAFVALATRGRR